MCVCVHMCMSACVCVHISVQVEARGHSSEAVHFGPRDRVYLLLPCKSKVSSWLCHPLTPHTPNPTRSPPHTLHPARPVTVNSHCCAVFS